MPAGSHGASAAGNAAVPGPSPRCPLRALRRLGAAPCNPRPPSDDILPLKSPIQPPERAARAGRAAASRCPCLPRLVGRRLRAHRAGGHAGLCVRRGAPPGPARLPQAGRGALRPTRRSGTAASFPPSLPLFLLPSLPPAAPVPPPPRLPPAALPPSSSGRAAAGAAPLIPPLPSPARPFQPPFSSGSGTWRRRRRRRRERPAPRTRPRPGHGRQHVPGGR